MHAHNFALLLVDDGTRYHNFVLYADIVAVVNRL